MVLVFDLGGTVTRIALSHHGELQEIARYDTDRSGEGFEAFLEQLHASADGRPVTAVAGGVPGQLKGADGELVVATNLPQWLGIPMVSRIRQLFDVPVHVANDVEMCGLGEARFGAGTLEGVMAYYTVSTGVNGVRLVDGDIDVTVSRYELGKQIVAGAEAAPAMLEPLIGGAATQQRWGKAPHTIDDPAVWASAEHYLAAGLYNTALYWNPQVIVVGGSMMRDIALRKVEAHLAKLPKIFDQWPTLVPAKLGDEAGLRGSVAYLERLGYR